MTDKPPLDIPLMELQRHHCREVTGTGDDGLALYCGQPKSGRTSYCDQHRRINLVMVAEASRGRSPRYRHEQAGRQHRPLLPAALDHCKKTGEENEKKKTEKIRHAGIRQHDQGA
jgi:hypothetical protein